MRLRSSATFFALAVLLALPGALQAQGLDIYKIPVPDPLAPQMGRAQPGVGASSPMGYGPSYGDIFAGFGYQAKATNGQQDGSLTAGGGFLDGSKTVGIEAVFTSVSTIRSGFGSRVLGAFKVHKSVSDWGLGLGIEGVYLNGNDFDTKPSVYFAATRAMDLHDGPRFNRATFNFGLGNGRFQAADNFAAGDKGIGFFATSAIQANEWSALILDYTGAQVNLAISFVPFVKIPLVMSASMNDITGEAGDRARLGVGGGLSWKY